jgi:hypothetical protein
MSARDHATIEELLAARALDGLDGEDAAALEREISAHGPSCDECRRLEVEFSEVAARLAFALDPLPVDSGMLTRILASPGPSSGGAGPSADDDTRASGPGDEVAAARRSHRARRTGWVGAVGIAAAVVLLAALVTVRNDSTQPVTRVSSAQRFVPFEGDVGELAMAYTPGEPGAVFWGRDLPDPGAGRVYEIWMVEDDIATSGGCVEPSGGRVGVSVDADIGTTDLMAVTVEPTCSDAPTSDPVFTASLA